MGMDILHQGDYVVSKKEWEQLRAYSAALSIFARKFSDELDGAGEGVIETQLPY